jgi:hypothetical protein
MKRTVQGEADEDDLTKKKKGKTKKVDNVCESPTSPVQNFSAAR